MALKQFVILNATFSRPLTPKMLNVACKRPLTAVCCYEMYFRDITLVLLVKTDADTIIKDAANRSGWMPHILKTSALHNMVPK